MVQNLDPNADKRAAHADGRDADEERERHRELRRKFLLGGAVTAGSIMTLASRPAIAGNGGQNACTVSAIGSLHPSQPVNQKCGDSPGCWGNGNGYPTWADGTSFNGVGLPYTHSTPVSTPLSLLGSAPFSGGSTTLSAMIINKGAAASAIQVKLNNGTKMNLLTPGQCLNVAAAILNDEFFGVHYYPTSIINFITGYLNSVVSYANANNSTSITNAMNQMDGTLDTLNNQGEVCPP